MIFLENQVRIKISHGISCTPQAAIVGIGPMDDPGIM